MTQYLNIYNIYIYVYMYVCIHVNMYTCIYVYMYICMHGIYICTILYMYIYIYMCVCVCVCVCVCGIPSVPKHLGWGPFAVKYFSRSPWRPILKIFRHKPMLCQEAYRPTVKLRKALLRQWNFFNLSKCFTNACMLTLHTKKQSKSELKHILL